MRDHTGIMQVELFEQLAQLLRQLVPDVAQVSASTLVNVLRVRVSAAEAVISSSEPNRQSKLGVKNFMASSSLSVARFRRRRVLSVSVTSGGSAGAPSNLPCWCAETGAC